VDELIESLRASSPGRLWTRVAPQLESWNLDLPSLILRGADAVSGVLMGKRCRRWPPTAIRFVVNFFLTTFRLFFFFREANE